LGSRSSGRLSARTFLPILGRSLFFGSFVVVIIEHGLLEAMIFCQLICPQPELWAPSLPPGLHLLRESKDLSNNSTIMSRAVIDGPLSPDTHYKCTPIQTADPIRQSGG